MFRTPDDCSGRSEMAVPNPGLAKNISVEPDYNLSGISDILNSLVRKLTMVPSTNNSSLLQGQFF